jgi:hypothetical protein
VIFTAQHGRVREEPVNLKSIRPPSYREERNLVAWFPGNLQTGSGIGGQKACEELIHDRIVGSMYSDRCPACNLPLHPGTLQAGILACRAGHRFGVRNAGVSPDDPHLFLEPVPLVSREGVVEVALASESHAAPAAFA